MLPHRHPFLKCAAALMLATTAAMSNVQAAEPPPAQSVAVGGVELKVAPRPVVAGANVWEFDVTLDTHSVSLGDDLAASSVLVVDGIEYKAVAWRGAAPGGHHRTGVLSFPAPAGGVQRVELRIARAGEAAPRLFRWDGAAWQR